MSTPYPTRILPFFVMVDEQVGELVDNQVSHKLERASTMYRTLAIQNINTISESSEVSRVGIQEKEMSPSR